MTRASLLQPAIIGDSSYRDVYRVYTRVGDEVVEHEFLRVRGRCCRAHDDFNRVDEDENRRVRFSVYIGRLR